MILALLLLHLLLGAAIVAVGGRVGRRGFALAAIAPAVTLVWLLTVAGSVLDGEPVTMSFDWVATLGLTFDLRLDAFGLVMVGLVSGIGLLVCLYALGYFSHPLPGTGRLAGLMTLFAGAMLGVVLTDHLLALFVFWELTSITSYLLIGNDDEDPKARDAALSAILITGAGGLAMLVGLVMIGQTAGTYRLSVLVADPPSGTLVTVALLLVLVGAFTKSAQAPFSGWLPGAMVAPTPISTYLHAATMVKAGVYLVARLSPLFATVGPWRPVLLIVGGTTMIVGGWRALRQHDLKLLLAFGTVSQLGFLMMLMGAGAYDLAQAGVVLLIAHGAFKAALFMVVGIVDHQTGTRDVREIDRLGAGWRPVVVIAIVSAASMAGLPPLLGFIAKEKALDAAVGADFTGALALTVAIVVGSILTVAYSGRFVLGLLGRLHVPNDDGASRTTATAPPPSIGFVAPAALLCAFTVAAGLAPVIVDRTVRAATSSLYPTSNPAAVKLWAGFNVALVLSVVVITVGAGLVAAHRRVGDLQTAVARVTRRLPDSDGTFWALVRQTLAGAKLVTRVVQNGSLPVYLMVILGVAAIAPLIPAIGQLDSWPGFVDTPMHVPLAAVIVAAAVGATVVRRRIAGALMLGAVGYAMAGFYIVQGAPDLALTQFAIETLATVLFVLVLRFLPRRYSDRRSAITGPIRLAIAGAVGVSVFVLALVATGARADVDEPPISGEMVQRSQPDGDGSNVVNVILVDFRGIDTLGEITVLVVAALGTAGLARVVRRPVRDPEQAPDPLSDATSTSRPSPDDVAVTGFARMPVVDAAARVLFPSIMVAAVYFLFAGHNQPGGGFVGGLTAGAAISLRYIAGGVSAVRRTFRLRPWTILGAGLLIAVVTALIPLVSGGSLLDQTAYEGTFALLGTIKFTTALPFDIGVFLVVVGLTLMAFEAFGDDAEPDDDADQVSPEATPPSPRVGASS